MKIVLNEPKRNIIVNFAPQIEGQKAREVTIQVQVILCQINIFCQQLTQNMKTFLSDLQKYNTIQIVLKFKNCKTCVLNIRTICVKSVENQTLSYGFNW